MGSIPARAGQPRSMGRIRVRDGVYPRTRGATTSLRLARHRVQGLSPHARGNPQRGRAWGRIRRSIPARAGQPVSSAPNMRPPTVYPRTRGATLTVKVLGTTLSGLSPHARGNRASCPGCAMTTGSIPARAGQPGVVSWLRYDHRVYPRTREATTTCPTIRQHRQGLSPHARGNRQPRLQPRSRWGSIPARAGQPTSSSAAKALSAVYPRTRGATRQQRAQHAPAHGLSPHARGNHESFGLDVGDGRSIPARAGQPALPNRRQPH